MYDPAPGVSKTSEIPDPLARAVSLEREITDLCAHINAANYRLLQLVAELDDEASWGEWGLRSCAHWLNWRCGIGLNAAQVEKLVRIYRRVGRLKERERSKAKYAARELTYYTDEDELNRFIIDLR